MLNGSNLTRKDLSHFWKKLFKGRRSGVCRNSQMKKKAVKKIGKKHRVKGSKYEKTKL